VSNSIQWWKPDYVLEGVRCTWADWLDALFGRRESFARIELDGSWCICEWRGMPDMLRDDDGNNAYVITAVRMTRRQFDRLPEFEGF